MAAFGGRMKATFACAASFVVISLGCAPAALAQNFVIPGLGTVSTTSATSSGGVSNFVGNLTTPTGQSIPLTGNFNSTNNDFRATGGPCTATGNAGAGTFAISPAGCNLALAPSSTTLSGAAALVAAQTLALQTAGVVLDRMSAVRSETNAAAQSFASEALGYTANRRTSDAFAAFKAPPAPVAGPTVRPAVWIKGFGDYEDRNNALGGLSRIDLGYRQSSGGVLGGADALIKNITSANDALLVGVLLGYSTSHIDLKGTQTTQNYDGGNVGIYATYLNGNWFTDFLFKTDFLDLNIAGGGVGQRAQLTNYNLAGNIGYKFDLANNYYIEPTAGIEYVRSDFSGISTTTPVTIPLNDGEATRGRLGARVGTSFIVNSVRIEPSLTGYVYSILSATNNTIVLNGLGTALPSDVNKARGEFQAAVSFFNLQSGVSGFVRADTRFGDDLLAVGVRVGLRYQM